LLFHLGSRREPENELQSERNLDSTVAFSTQGGEQQETSMSSYRLRDAAVLVGAVVVGAAAGFNGGWLAAVPPKAPVETTNKLATSDVGSRVTTKSPRSEPQIQSNDAATDRHEVRAVQPSGQAGETRAEAQPKTPLVPSQPLDDVRVPASPSPIAPTAAAPVPRPPQAPSAAAASDVHPQMATSDQDEPRTTGQSERGRPEAKKKIQKAAVKKLKRKEPKVQEANADQRADSKRTESDAERAAPERSDVRQKVVNRSLKRRDYESREIVSDDDDDTDWDAVAERSEVRREYRRRPAEGYVRGRAIEQREPEERGVVVERERPPRVIQYEEPQRGFGLFDLFER
jgi:hypothetical protein